MIKYYLVGRKILYCYRMTIKDIFSVMVVNVAPAIIPTLIAV